MANADVTRWLTQARVEGRKEGIPPDVLLGLIQIESGGREGLTSSADAGGLTQFIPGTAKQYGVDTSPGHAWSQIRGAAKYLKALGFAKDPVRALAAYNAGPGNVQAGIGYAHNVLAAAKGYRGLAANAVSQAAPSAPEAPAESAPGVSVRSAAAPSSAGLEAIVASLAQQQPAGPTITAPAAPSFAAGPRVASGFQAPSSSGVQQSQGGGQAALAAALSAVAADPGSKPQGVIATTAQAPTAAPPRSTGKPGGGDAGVVEFANSRIGHYVESAGQNRGPELDQLEKQAGFTGAQWCSIFATTAVVHGTGNKAARTASVPELTSWAKQGSHGYEKGVFSVAQARAGDLVVRRGEHVGVVVSSSGGKLVVVEGNAGSHGVERNTYSTGSSPWTGVVRPKARRE